MLKKKKKTLILFCLNSNITKGRNIHLCLENPDGPWTHKYLDIHPDFDPELNQWKIIVSGRRSIRVRNKVENILEQLISGAVEKVENDRRNGSGDDDSGDGETESEEEDQTSGDCSEDSEDDIVAQDLSARSCQFCNKLFSKRGNKADHENYVHKKELECLQSLQLHLQNHNPKSRKKDPIGKRSHSCKVDPGCRKVFSNKTSLWYHQLRAHGKAVCCEKCSKEFTDFKEFVKHRRSERGNPEVPVAVKCSICKIPISSQHLKRHMTEVHKIPTKNPLKEPAELHHCPHCNQQFKRVENMQRHIVDIHSLSKNEKWKCGQCEKSFFFERNLKLHTERVHAHFPFFSTFNCNQCEMSFKVKGNLTRHQKEQHSDEEMFFCPFCGKSFKRKSNQVEHSYTCKKRTK